jgi:hypothetical protein
MTRFGPAIAAILLTIAPALALDDRPAMHDPSTAIAAGVSRRVTLKRGSNMIRAGVINAGGATDFCARFLDADDAPVAGLVTPTLTAR